MDTDEDFGRRLRTAREAKGIGPREAARRVHIAYSTLMNHEQGHRGARKRATDYARIYGVNLLWLSTGSGPMKGADPLVADVLALEPDDRAAIEALVNSFKSRRGS